MAQKTGSLFYARFLTLLLTVSLAVPSPLFAFKPQEAAEGAGLEELRSGLEEPPSSKQVGRRIRLLADVSFELAVDARRIHRETKRPFKEILDSQFIQEQVRKLFNQYPVYRDSLRRSGLTIEEIVGSMQRLLQVKGLEPQELLIAVEGLAIVRDVRRLLEREPLTDEELALALRRHVDFQKGLRTRQYKRLLVPDEATSLRLVQWAKTSVGLSPASGLEEKKGGFNRREFGKNLFGIPLLGVSAQDKEAGTELQPQERGPVLKLLEFYTRAKSYYERSARDSDPEDDEEEGESDWEPDWRDLIRLKKRAAPALERRPSSKEAQIVSEAQQDLRHLLESKLPDQMPSFLAALNDPGSYPLRLEVQRLVRALRVAGFKDISMKSEFDRAKRAGMTPESYRKDAFRQYGERLARKAQEQFRATKERLRAVGVPVDDEYWQRVYGPEDFVDNFWRPVDAGKFYLPGPESRYADIERSRRRDFLERLLGLVDDRVDAQFGKDAERRDRPDVWAEPQRPLQELAEAYERDRVEASQKQRLTRVLDETVKSRRRDGVEINEQELQQERVAVQNLPASELDGIDPESYARQVLVKYPVDAKAVLRRVYVPELPSRADSQEEKRRTAQDALVDVLFVHLLPRLKAGAWVGIGSVEAAFNEQGLLLMAAYAPSEVRGRLFVLAPDSEWGREFSRRLREYGIAADYRPEGLAESLRGRVGKEKSAADFYAGSVDGMLLEVALHSLQVPMELQRRDAGIGFKDLFAHLLASLTGTGLEELAGKVDLGRLSDALSALLQA